MISPNRIAEVAAVMADPARAAMLAALMEGRALTAGELAIIAGVTPQTASTHLSRMIGTDLVAMTRQGRHRYHRLASERVASMLEGLMLHALDPSRTRSAVHCGPRNEAMRVARTCYDHFAGRLGVAIADALVAKRHVILDDDTAVLTRKGLQFFDAAGILAASDIGIDTRQSTRRRPLCRTCLDWSERRLHIAGRLGAAICSHAFEQGWVRRSGTTRAALVTPKGRRAFKDVLGVQLD